VLILKSWASSLSGAEVYEGSSIYLCWLIDWWASLNSGPHTYLGRHSITSAMLPVLFTFIFQVGSHFSFFTQGGLDCDPPTYATHTAGMTGMSHHTKFFFVEVGSHRLELVLHFSLSSICLSSNWDDRHKPPCLAKWWDLAQLWQLLTLFSALDKQPEFANERSAVSVLFCVWFWLLCYFECLDHLPYTYVLSFQGEC
jgi:hypothetical protein